MSPSSESMAPSIKKIYLGKSDLFSLINQNRKMLFVFEDKNGELYDSPDSFVLSLPQQTIEWGTKLNIYQVYKRGDPSYCNYQSISAMFFHEGETSSLDGTYWIGSDWYDMINTKKNIGIVDTGKVIRFELGNDCPQYFKTKEDLGWYISNVYPLNEIQITKSI